MTKEEKSLLLAMAIGDGHIHKDPRSLSCSLSLKHSIKQKEYLIWKVNIARSILGGSPNKIVEFNNSGYPGIRWSKADNYFRILRKRLYKNNKKNISRKLLDKLGRKEIAIWYMDDGNLSHKYRNGKIHARELFINTHISKEENQKIICYFSEIWNINFSQVKNRGSYRLRCGTREAQRFIKLVKPHIIPSLSYKIDMKY